MKDFFQPNINHRSRVSRAIIGTLCLIAGVVIFIQVKRWIGLILVGIGLFTILEAVSKWCILRACGIKTKL
jgi:Protein of unknown function (DUF2892)